MSEERFWQEDTYAPVQRRGLGIEESLPSSKRQQREVGPELRRVFRCKKGFFRRGPGAYQHGLRGATFTRELQCCQAILCLGSGTIEEVAACSFIFVCSSWFPPGIPVHCNFLVTVFQRNEHGFEAFSPHVSFTPCVNLWSPEPSRSVHGIPQALN